MKHFLSYFSILFLFSFADINAQTIVLSIDTMYKYAIAEDSLIKLYPQAINNNNKLSILKSAKEQQAFQMSYNSMFREFATFLRTHDFKWEKNTSCFHRIYCRNNGIIDLFTFSFLKKANESSAINDEKYNQYAYLLKEFLKNYKLNIKTKSRFSYSSPYIYQEVLINKNKTEQ